MNATGRSKEQFEKVMRAIRETPSHFIEGNAIPVWDGTGKNNKRWLSWREFARFLQLEGATIEGSEKLAKACARVA